MAIVINDFEAVAEAPPTQPAVAQTDKDRDGKATPQALDPHDVAPVLHMLADRALRVWAH